jgi:hypothetical protein
MAVHLRMDFRILELSATLHILQCQRGSTSCEYGVEYNPKHSGALVRAIHDLRTHTCAPMGGAGLSKPPQVVDIRRAIQGTQQLRSGS